MRNRRPSQTLVQFGVTLVEMMEADEAAGALVHGRESGPGALLLQHPRASTQGALRRPAHARLQAGAHARCRNGSLVEALSATQHTTPPTLLKTPGAGLDRGPGAAS